MSKKATPKAKAKPVERKKINETSSDRSWLFSLVPVLIITAVSFLPMLNNGFTNWDDNVYITQNQLLKDLDWAKMFTEASASNYHPLTMVSLGFNYLIGGTDPFSYHLVNWLLHILNTALVFLFIYKISGRKTFVAAFTAIVFGVHPMHVESVAWVSERKDVLYTFFFLLSLIQYWNYLETGKRKGYVFCVLFFILSLLSKPAAIILPFVLLLLDYWKGRPLKWKAAIEKMPLLILSFVFGFVTIKVQSADAIAGLDQWPLWSRFFFACYTTMIYAVRFIVPYPLSAFHPYPSLDSLGMMIYLSPIFIVALLGILWLKRKDKLVVFSVLFFLVNLVLVIQIVTVGLTIVSERYTYVPYIGLGFLAGMLLNKYFEAKQTAALKALPLIVGIVFGLICFQRTKVWRDGDTLWSDVIKRYPNAATPRANHGNYLRQMADLPENASRRNELLLKALDECTKAITLKPTHIKAYENRQSIHLELKNFSLAMADADSLLKFQPTNAYAFYKKGSVYAKINKPDSALLWYNNSLKLNPNSDIVLNHRGSLLFNNFQNYHDALNDFSAAIAINPQGEYYYHRSLCYYKLGDVPKARADALIATQKGYAVPASFKNLIQLN